MINENINDYCTNQNLIVRYPNGAAGKFLITCLFLIDRVAHWEPQVQTKSQDHWQWFDQSWQQEIHKWIISEPNQPWEINFYSRRLDRNNQLTASEYNQLVKDNASDYFFQCWKQGLYIVDHWHKRSRPSWQLNANIIEITINKESLDAYRQLIARKLWLWDSDRSVVVSTLDHPDYSHCDFNRLQRLSYHNVYEFTGYNNYDEFFNGYLMNQTFVKSFYQVGHDDSCLASFDLLELFEYSKLKEKLTNIADQLNSHIDLTLLNKMHQLWLKRSHIR